MKAKINLINPNLCGTNSEETFQNIKDLKKYLNEALYYSEEIYLWVDCFYNDVFKYSETNDIRSLLTEANYYDSILNVAPTFEKEL